MGDPRLEALLRALHPGQRLWLRAGGRSLWPLVLDRDQLLVERGDEAALKRGEIALVVDDRDRLVAHLVEALRPLRTVSSVGVVDAPAKEVLGKVVAVRRGERTVRLVRGARHLLKLVPPTARVFKRVAVLRLFVQLLRDRAR